MPLNLTHNHFGDYTPLARTPSNFKGPSLIGTQDVRLDLDELKDRPHFGIEDIKSARRGFQGPVSGEGKPFLND